jgi:signal transduction histidine kinase
MKDSVHKMVQLTNQLLAYAQGGKFRPETISLSEFVDDTIPLIRHPVSPSVRLEIDLNRDISEVHADLRQMHMVLSSVIANASEAIEGPGRIRILTKNERINGEPTQNNLGLEPGSYVCLTVEDDGKGMDEETRSRMFEPFYSTKFQGRGLGMAAVYGIVKNHLGSISVDSEPGRGTVVRVYLPATNGAPKSLQK